MKRCCFIEVIKMMMLMWILWRCWCDRHDDVIMVMIESFECCALSSLGKVFIHSLSYNLDEVNHDDVGIIW